MSADLHAAAVGYIERGWPVHVHKIDGEKGATYGTLKQTGARWGSTLDIETIDSWLAQGSTSIGIPTGPVSGLMVVDVDDPEAWTVLSKHHAEPVTLTNMTGGGNGRRQLLFQYPENISIPTRAGLPVDGIDVRGEGGQFVAPPSLHKSGRHYGWADPTVPVAPLPQWLLIAIVGEIGIGVDLLRTEVQTLLDTPSGRHNDQLLRSAKALYVEVLTHDSLTRDQVDSALRSVADSWGHEPGRVSNTLGNAWRYAEEAVPEPKDTKPPVGLATRKASSYRPKRTRWLWDGRIPIGELTIITGRPKVGKSTVMLELMADLTRGHLPGELLGQPTPVMLVTTEDAIEETLVPRLMAANAKLDLVHFATEIPTLPDDIDKLFVTARNEGVRVVLLDPLLSRLARGLNADKDPDVRQALEPLVLKAHDAGVTVLGVMHNNKGQSTDPLNNLMSSRAFGAVPRSILSADQDPNGPDRLLSHVVCSVGPTAKTLKYQFDIVEVGSDDGPITASHVKWGGEDPRDTIEILTETQQAKAERRGPAQRDLAIAWLRNYLHHGPRLKADVLNDSPFSESTTRRAFKDINAVSVIEAPGGPATWRLPSTPEEISTGGNT